MIFKIVNKARYELLEKMVQRQDNYIEQIKIINAKVKQLKDDNNKLIDLINNKNKDIKKLSGKIGGLTKNINLKVKDNNLLKDKIRELKNINLNLKDQLVFYKKYGISNEKLEKFKDYTEIRKELEKRRKEQLWVIKKLFF